MSNVAPAGAASAPADDFPIRPYSPRSRKEEVDLRIKEYIATNELGPGDRLPGESWFAAQLGVGRPLIREAFRGLEAVGVIETRKGEAGGRDLDLFIYRAGIEVVPVDQEQAEVARIAWRRYGKGRHPAGLNYGDCFAYALAKISGAPLLFKGNDFGQTDLDAATAA